MYKLTLTLGERKAIDFVGDSYRHGHELYTLLCRADWYIENGDNVGDWDCANDLTMHIPEHLAWDIRDLIEDTFNDTGLACFADSLRSKLFDFSNAIV